MKNLVYASRRVKNYLLRFMADGDFVPNIHAFQFNAQTLTTHGESVKGSFKVINKAETNKYSVMDVDFTITGDAMRDFWDLISDTQRQEECLVVQGMDVVHAMSDDQLKEFHDYVRSYKESKEKK